MGEKGWVGIYLTSRQENLLMQNANAKYEGILT